MACGDRGMVLPAGRPPAGRARCRPPHGRVLLPNPSVRRGEDGGQGRDVPAAAFPGGRRQEHGPLVPHSDTSAESVGTTLSRTGEDDAAQTGWTRVPSRAAAPSAVRQRGPSLSRAESSCLPGEGRVHCHVVYETSVTRQRRAGRHCSVVGVYREQRAQVTGRIRLQLKPQQGGPEPQADVRAPGLCTCPSLSGIPCALRSLCWHPGMHPAGLSLPELSWVPLLHSALS